MKIATAFMFATLLVGSAASAQNMMSSVPSSSKTITNWYKQDVYDQSDSTIGKIDDVLVSSSGQVDALIMGVGGFLGAGEKDVAVPFSAVKWTSKNNKKYLTMNTTKDELKAAQNLKYDRDRTTWVPAK